MKNGWVVDCDAEIHYIDDIIHHDTGPAIVYPKNDLEFYVLNGIRVPSFVVMSKELKLDDLKNSEFDRMPEPWLSRLQLIHKFVKTGRSREVADYFKLKLNYNCGQCPVSSY